MKRNLVYAKVLALLLFLVLNNSCSQESSDKGPVQERQKAPTFILNNIDGKSISLIKLRGKLVLLNFWASWCIPCVREMPLFQKRHEIWAEKGLVFLSINCGEDLGTVRGFMQGYGFTFPVLLDVNSEVSVRYDVKYFPTNLLIDTDGTIIKRKIGAFENEEMMDKEVFSLLSASK